MFLVAGFGLSIATASLVASVWRTTWHPAAVLDLNGRPIDPLGHPRGRATVLVFTRSDCPISNRYAPEVRRLTDRFAPEGVGFWLVYVDPDDGPQVIQQHVAEYGYSLRVARDTDHLLVRLTGASVTPEAAVYDSSGSLVYCGRIDNRYEDLDRRRSVPTRHDLEEALAAVLAGRDPEVSKSRAVGCYIADLR